MLPGRPFLIGEKLEQNAKIQKFKWDILVDFQQCNVVIFLNLIRLEYFLGYYSIYIDLKSIFSIHKRMVRLANR